MDPLSIALEAIPKALVYAAVVLSVGVPAARLLFLARVAASESLSAPSAGATSAAAAPASADAAALLDASLSRTALLAAAALLVGLLLRAWGHTAVSFGIADSFTPDNLILIAWESQWGQAWTLQMAGAATLAVMAWATTQAPPLAWPLLSLLAAAMCYLLPLMGHAAGAPAAVLVHGSHVLAAGVWVGTLMAMVLAVPLAVRPAMLRAFAPLAFAGSGVLATSGLVAAWWYLDSPMHLIDSTYGWVLGLKIVFVADVAVFGFLNWRRFHGAGDARRASGHAGAPSVPSAPGARESFALLEVLMALAVIAVTAVLTELEHP